MTSVSVQRTLFEKQDLSDLFMKPIWMQNSLDFVIISLAVLSWPIQIYLKLHQKNRSKEDPREQNMTLLLMVTDWAGVNVH